MKYFYDIKNMSTNGLAAQHRSINDRLIEEHGQPAGQERIYGVRKYQDWHDMADEIEAELDARQFQYTKIQW